MIKIMYLDDCILFCIREKNVNGGKNTRKMFRERMMTTIKIIMNHDRSNLNHLVSNRGSNLNKITRAAMWTGM